MRINKLKVALSMVIPFLTVFVTAFVLLYIDLSNWQLTGNQFIELLTVSSVLWGPSVIICLILEYVMLKPEADKKRLQKLLMIETIIASILSLYLLPVILLVGGLGNTLRYQWLVYKNRLYKPLKN